MGGADNDWDHIDTKIDDEGRPSLPLVPRYNLLSDPSPHATFSIHACKDNHPHTLETI